MTRRPKAWKVDDVDAGEVVRKALADLLGGLAVEGEHKDLAWRDAPVADEVGDLAGDHGGLARARTGEHQRGVLVRGDRRRLLGSRRRGEHALGRSGHGGSGGGDEASVRLLPRRLVRLDARDRLDACQRPGRLRGQEGSRQGATSALHGAGDVRLEPAALRLARIAATGVETVQAVAELCEFRRQRPGDAGGVRAYRLGEPLGLVAGEPADGALGAAGLAHGQSRPEPRAARLDAVDSANRRALGVPEAQHAAVERDTCRASAEQPNEGCAGRAHRGGIWCLHRAGCGDIWRSRESIVRSRTVGVGSGWGVVRPGSFGCFVFGPAMLSRSTGYAGVIEVDTRRKASALTSSALLGPSASPC